MNDLIKFNQLQADLTLFVTPIKDLKVSDRDTSSSASDALKDVKRWDKKLEEKRKELVSPLNDQVSRINEFVKTLKAPLALAEVHLKKELLAFELVLERERQEKLKVEAEERRKREEEARALIKAQQEEAETLAMFADKGEVEKLKAQAHAESQRIEFEAKKEHWDAVKEIKSDKVSGVRRTWTFEIIDESLVPVEFKSVDEKKIRKAMSNEVREIPGVRIYQETSITARGV